MISLLSISLPWSIGAVFMPSDEGRIQTRSPRVHFSGQFSDDRFQCTDANTHRPKGGYNRHEAYVHNLPVECRFK